MKYFFTLAVLLWGVVVFSQKKDNYPKDWHHKCPKKDKVLGIGTYRTYEELLKGKSPQTVVVAVIDGGVDIRHEELQGKIWFNEDEIPDNDIDDDNNGYVDDRYGWNFIGNSKGENIHNETLEITRIVANNIEVFRAIEKGIYAFKDEKEKQYFFRVYRRFVEKYNKALNSGAKLVLTFAKIMEADSIIKAHLKRDSISAEDIEKLDVSNNDKLKQSKEILLELIKNNITEKELSDALEEERKKLAFQLNPEYDARQEIIGDDPTRNDNRFYGNKDVIGPDPFHGTACAGIIAANRQNKKGIEGIAPAVKIMCIRVVPDGDERDKDVANAIRYAVDNGAKIISMSFGKEFSPEKYLVDEVLNYIKGKDVLLVHSAGNDAFNTDDTLHYPINIDDKGDTIFHNWITVGASGSVIDKSFPAKFSNYGAKTVDIFAPGVNIYTLKPDNEYGAASGTSFSTPVVSGIAAVLLSYYPELNCAEVKDIILKSGTDLSKKKVLIPDKTETYKKRKKARFGTLCRTGKVANLYNAVKMAEELSNKKKTGK